MGITMGFTWGHRLGCHPRQQPKPQHRGDVRGSAVIPDSLGHKRHNTSGGQRSAPPGSGSPGRGTFPIALRPFPAFFPSLKSSTFQGTPKSPGFGARPLSLRLAERDKGRPTISGSIPCRMACCFTGKR